MAQLSYREAVNAAIAQEMRRDDKVVFIGEDVAAPGGVFKTTVGLQAEFGDLRVRDCPIAEQAILGAVAGAAMTGLKPIAEIMFSDFFAVCWDIVVNQIAKTRFMTDGQCSFPLVIRSANGGGSRFGAQHSQSVENWAMAVPGLKVVAPSSPADVKGLLAAAIQDPDPVLFFEQKSLYGTKGDVPEGDHVDQLGKAKVLREGSDVTIIALAAMVRHAMKAADTLQNTVLGPRWPDRSCYDSTYTAAVGRCAGGLCPAECQEGRRCSRQTRRLRKQHGCLDATTWRNGSRRHGCHLVQESR
jgi:pyruvate dehydrogenase E1 component beta subunit